MINQDSLRKEIFNQNKNEKYTQNNLDQPETDS